LRKLLAVLVLYILLASAAFAEISVFGTVGGGAVILRGTNVNGDVLQAGASLSGQIGVEGQDENDKFGGEITVSGEKISFNIPVIPGSTAVVPVPGNDPVFAFNASVWWKPFYMLKLQLGGINDFALTEIVGWGYHANDADSFVVWPQNNYAGDYFSDTTGFYSGTGNGWTGLSLSFSPIYGLDINVGIPFSLGFEKINQINGEIEQRSKASAVYYFTSAQIAYNLWGIGRLAVSYAGGDGKIKYTPNPINPEDDTPTRELYFFQMQSTPATIYGSFLLTVFEERGISLNAGFAYTFPAKEKDQKITYKAPMEAGLGFSMGTSRMGFKTRMALSFGGSAFRDGTDPTPKVKEPLMIGLGVLPYITLGPFKINLNAGISYKWEEEYMKLDGLDLVVAKMGNSAALAWYVNPYLTFSIGDGTFFAGFQMGSDGLKYTHDGTTMKKNNLVVTFPSGEDKYVGQTIIEWAIPIGIQYSF